MSYFKSLATFSALLALTHSLGAKPAGGGDPPDPYLYPLPVKHYAVIDLSGGVQGQNQVFDVAIGDDGQAAFGFRDGDDIKIALWKNGGIVSGPVKTGNLVHVGSNPGAEQGKVYGGFINSRGGFAGNTGDGFFGSWAFGDASDHTVGQPAQQVKAVTENGMVVTLDGYFGYVPVGSPEPVDTSYGIFSTWPYWIPGSPIISRHGFVIYNEQNGELICSDNGGDWASFSDLPGLPSNLYYEIWSVNDAHQFFAFDAEHSKTFFYDGLHSKNAAEMTDPNYRVQVKIPWDQSPGDVYDDKSALVQGQYLADPKSNQWQQGLIAFDLDPQSATSDGKWPPARVEFPSNWSAIPIKSNASGVFVGYGTKLADENGPISVDQQNAHAVLLLPIVLINLADPAKGHGGRDTTIEFKTNDNDANIRAFAWIAAHDPNNHDAPRMPKLVAKAGNLNGTKVFWKLRVVFHDRHGNPHRDFDTGDPNDASSASSVAPDDTVVIPKIVGSQDPKNEDGWHVIDDGTPWNIYQNEDWLAEATKGFFGGDAVLSLKITKTDGTVILSPQDYKFRIAGENPDYTKCKDYICSKYGGPAIPTRDPDAPNGWQGFWFAYAIAKKETEGNGGRNYYNQFLDDGALHQGPQSNTPNPLKRGKPNWNNDGTDKGRPTGTGGYGLFQHTYEQGELNYIMPRKRIWNWQDNVDGIQAKFTEKLNIESQTYKVLRNVYPALGDIPNHLAFSGVESLVITFYNGGGGQIKSIPQRKRLTCWWGEDVSSWKFLKNQNNYVDEVSGNLD